MIVFGNAFQWPCIRRKKEEIQASVTDKQLHKIDTPVGESCNTVIVVIRWEYKRSTQVCLDKSKKQKAETRHVRCRIFQKKFQRASKEPFANWNCNLIGVTEQIRCHGHEKGMTHIVAHETRHFLNQCRRGAIHGGDGFQFFINQSHANQSIMFQ